jgi:hypothetical protein
MANRHDHRDSDSGQFHGVPTSGDPDRYAGDVPLSGKVEHDPMDGKPWTDHEVGPGWEPVGE